MLACVDGGLLEHWRDLPERIAGYARAHRGLRLAGGPVVIPGGETAKNDRTVLETVTRKICDARLCRHSYVLAVGGGAVLDAVGFAASIAHRGVRLVRVPTTTLAQADAGIGVKNAVNAYGQKNFLGAFAPPWAVVNDHTFLRTLSGRDWRAGISEAVKVALLKDAESFGRIADAAEALADRDEDVLRPIVQRSAQLHAGHIARCGDPFELSTARPLDFGHWSAHRLETMTDYQVGHGEAVAIGIALDCAYAALAGMLDAGVAGRVTRVLQSLGFATHHPALRDTSGLVKGLDEFRMHLGGRLTVTLIRGVGEPVEVDRMDERLIERAVRQLATS